MDPTLKRRSEVPEDGGSYKVPRLSGDNNGEGSSSRPSARYPAADVVVEIENDESDMERYRQAIANRTTRITAKRTRRRARGSDDDSSRRDDRASSHGGASEADTNEYEVAGIEGKYVERNGRTLYKVRWATGQTTKEPIENLDGCVQLIEAFEHRMKDHENTEPSLKRWYLSDQRTALGYTKPTERENQGYNTGNQLLNRRTRSSLFRYHGQDESSDSESSADSDDDGGVEYNSASDDEEDEDEVSGDGDLDDNASGQNEDGGETPPSQAREQSPVDPQGRRDAATSLPSAQGSARARSEQPIEAGGASSKRLRKPPVKLEIGTDEPQQLFTNKPKSKPAAAPAPGKVVTHHTVCEKCGMGSRKKRNDDEEESGPILNCMLCTNTYHLNCIGGYRSRDRRPKFTSADFVCQMCRAETPVCLYCNQGFVDEVAFRCDRCAGLGHDACLVVEFDENFNILYDEELDCEEGSVYWFHKKWKCIDCVRWSDEVHQILTYRDLVEGDQSTREYLIKYKNHSHRHNDWVSDRWLASLINGKQRYKTFWKKVEEENGRALKWGLQTMPWPKPEAEAVPNQWKHIDRILDVQITTDIPKKKKGPVKEEADVRVERALIKFQDQPWNESYWEKFPAEGEPDFAEFQMALKAFQRRETLAPPKIVTKSRRRFEELSAQPETLKGGDLKDYQLEGLNWLLFNHSELRSCILADEMGLGKTIQTIAFLNYLLEKQGLVPFLIVVPQSTLLNWVREFKHWVPDMEVLTFYGEKPARDIIKDYAMFQNSKSKDSKPLKCHVLLTTPDTLQLETKVFQEVKWEVLVVDEGHQRVKNAESLQFEALSSLTANHRVLLTGTPVQNNLLEMFNLLHFLDRENFPDPGKLAERFGERLDKDKLAELHNIVRPYILRRIKSDVLQALPGKSETIVPVGLSAFQRSLYKQILLDNYEVLASGALKKKSASARSQLISKVLADIRRLLQHPYLLKDREPKFPTREETHRRLIESSGKLFLLDQMLKRLIATGHRVLIFSTMKLVLDILEDYLIGERLKYCRLDGETSMKDRQERIDLFNSPGSDIPVFLLTTRAGGLGINLTSADSVIIWDSDWNPHQDLQALARAHRIGQQRHVGVWKFVTKGTAEERIFHIAKKKLILDHLVVQKLEEETLDEKDVEGVLRFGAEQLFASEEGEGVNEMSITYDDAAIDKLLERIEEEKPKENEKKASSFSFAKVWETKAQEHAVEELGAEPLEVIDLDEEMPPAEEQQGDVFWEKLLHGRVQAMADKTVQDERRTRKEVDYGTTTKRPRKSGGVDFASAAGDGDEDMDAIWEESDSGEEENSSEGEPGTEKTGQLSEGGEASVDIESDFDDGYDEVRREIDIMNDPCFCYLCGKQCAGGAIKDLFVCLIAIDIPALKEQVLLVRRNWPEDPKLRSLYRDREDILVKQVEYARHVHSEIRQDRDWIEVMANTWVNPAAYAVDSPPDTSIMDSPQSTGREDTPDPITLI